MTTRKTSILCDAKKSWIGPLLLLMSATADADALKSVAVAVGEWKPVVSKSLPHYGTATLLVTRILERTGYRPEYIFMPWGQAESRVRDNETGMGPRITFPFLKTAKRRQEFIFSERPVLRACMKFFVNLHKLDDRPDSIDNIERLSGYTIGYVSAESGYQYPEVMDDLLRTSGVEFAGLYEVFESLISEDANSVQVIPAIESVSLQLLYDLFPEQRDAIAVLQETNLPPGKPCLLPVDYFLLASRKNPDNAEFMEKFDRAFRSMDKQSLAAIQRQSQEIPNSYKPKVRVELLRGEILVGSDDDGDEYALPRGTRALLLEWLGRASQAKIEILNGPYRGKVLHVDARAVVLE